MIKGSIQVGVLLVAVSAACDSGPVASGDDDHRQAPDVVVRLDAGSQFQTITGWEASAQAGDVECAGFDLYKDELYDRAVDDLGINRLRVPIRSGVENRHDYFQDWVNGTLPNPSWRELRYATENDNADPFDLDMSGFIFTELDGNIQDVVLPLKQRLEARGESLWINLTYVAFTDQIGQGLAYDHVDPEEYAEFVLATYLRLRDRWGIVPDSWEVLLEPDNVIEWGGRRLGLAILAAAARLEAHGFEPVFIAPSTTSMGRASSYFDDLTTVPGAVDYVKELAYHRYIGVSASNLADIVSRAQAYGIQTSMLEHIGSGYEDLHEDLKDGMNTAWQQFALAFCGSGENDNGGVYYAIDTRDPSDPKILDRSRTPFLRQYFRFIRRDARRIGASSTSENRIDPLAFVNEDGSYVVVLKADRSTTIGIEGLPADTYGIMYTTDEGSMELSDVVLGQAGAVSATIPARGVLTVYGR